MKERASKLETGGEKCKSLIKIRKRFGNALVSIYRATTLDNYERSMTGKPTGILRFCFKKSFFSRFLHFSNFVDKIFFKQNGEQKKRGHEKST